MSTKPLHPIAFTILCSLTLLSSGCTGDKKSQLTDAKSPEVKSQETETASKAIEAPDQLPSSYEINAQALLDAALPDELLNEGWISLFDGQSLFGWFIVGKANWRVEQGIIKVDQGEKSFLCTNFSLGDYELSVDFRGDAETNSGIFLRTQPSPQNVTDECIELNIAPPTNPFPTGSLVERKKLEPAELGSFDPSTWHTYSIRFSGDVLEVMLDGKKILDYTDDSGLTNGHISLQHNAGRIEFKNVRLRPLNLQSLKLNDAWQDDWNQSQKDGVEFSVAPNADGLKITGGLGQVQSKAEWSDFILQASYRLAKPEVNSGIFFRCVRDGMLDGYECQLNHAIIADDPLRPADAGAGAIFRRQPARIVMGDGTKTSYVTLLARGPQIQTWINGIQTVDFVDTRDADDNPRKGLRTAAGPIALQGHDPTTDVIFESIRVTALK